DINPMRRALVAGKDRPRVLVIASQGLGKRLFAKVGDIELRTEDVLGIPPVAIDDVEASRGSADEPHTGIFALDSKEWQAAPEAQVPSGPRHIEFEIGSQRYTTPLKSGFDICICELNESDLLRADKLVNTIWFNARADVSIFLFHWNDGMGRLDVAEKLIAADALTFDFPSRLHAAATLNRAANIRRWEEALQAVQSGSITARLRGMMGILQAMGSAVM